MIILLSIVFLSIPRCEVLDQTNDGYVYFDDIIPNLELTMNNLLFNVETINAIELCLVKPFIWQVPLWVYEGDSFEVTIDMPIGDISRHMLVPYAPFPIYLMDGSSNLMLFGTDFDPVIQGYRQISFTIVIYDYVWGKAWLLPFSIELRD